MQKVYSLLILSIIILFTTSCREEVIEPGNIAGNVNSPVIENNKNYFSLVINAENLSSSYNSLTDFSFITNKTLLTISDISNGSVRITIRDQNGASLFNSTNLTEIENDSRKISGAVPKSVEFTFSNFTGKLRFSLSYNSNN